MKAVILDADSLGQDISLSPLRDLPLDWHIFASTQASETMERIQGAELIFTNKVYLGQDHFAANPQIKFVNILATGMNNIDLVAAKEAGIVVKNVQAYSTESVVQHTLALIFALRTRLADNMRASCDGRWQNSPFFCYLGEPVSQLAGQTLAIVGYGAQGKLLAKQAQALGMKVKIASLPNRPQSTDDCIQRTPLEDLLPHLDILSLHCPLSHETENLIAAPQLKKMKKSAIVINCARGGIIHEEDLAEALQNSEIAGAALDVLTEEPPAKDHPLINSQHPNLIITPHMAWSSTSSRELLVKKSAENLMNFLGQ